MKKIILISLLVLVIVGCVQIQQPLCDASYTEYKKGECCLDKNDNKICDDDEKTIFIAGEDKKILEKCIISISSGLICDSFTVVPRSHIAILVKNTLQDEITFIDGSVSDGENTCLISSDIIDVSKKTVTIHFNKDSEAGSCKEMLDHGKAVKADMELTFKDEDDFIKTTSGSIWVNVPK